jgi:hypothetical protein
MKLFNQFKAVMPDCYSEQSLFSDPSKPAQTGAIQGYASRGPSVAECAGSYRDNYLLIPLVATYQCEERPDSCWVAAVVAATAGRLFQQQQNDTVASERHVCMSHGGVTRQLLNLQSRNLCMTIKCLRGG